MRSRIPFIVVVFFAFVSAALAEPKAYEVVKYEGKADGMTFVLEYGSGYPEASHMRVKDSNGKSTLFDLDGSGEARFVPRKQGRQKREIVLKMQLDNPSEKIDGTYTVDGKEIHFTLR